MKLESFRAICDECDCLLEYVSPVEACVNLMGDESNLKDFRDTADSMDIALPKVMRTSHDKVYFELGASDKIKEAFNKIAPLFSQVIQDAFRTDSDLHRELHMEETEDGIKVWLNFHDRKSLMVFMRIWREVAHETENYDVAGVFTTNYFRNGVPVLEGNIDL